MSDAKQIKNVSALYDSAAEVYDEEYEALADYQAPTIAKKFVEKYSIQSGSVLDIGCGTGKLVDYLGKNFSYTGVDISANMRPLANKKGMVTVQGDAVKILSEMNDKSFDYLFALSSLYFIENFQEFINQCDRVVRKAYFLTLEQFSEEVFQEMAGKGIQIFNNDVNIIQNPTEVLKDIYLWTRPKRTEKINGNIVFKKM